MALAVPVPDRGALFVVSGPSGVGKSTLVSHVVDSVPHLGFSVSATTRAPRPGEVDGVHYHFMNDDEFEQAIARGAFLEHAGVYGKRYGTLAEPVRTALDAGRSVLLDIDVQGAAQVRRSLPDAVHVFIVPPSREVLAERLRGRGTEDEGDVRRRLRDGEAQLRGLGTYDHLVVNDDLEVAKATLLGIVLATLADRRRQEKLVRRWTGP